MSTVNLPIETHPDIAALRDRYDQAAGTLVGQFTEYVTVLTGLYFAASPWIVGFHGETNLMMNDLIAGLAVAVFASCATVAYGRFHALAPMVPLLGIWFIISPWVVADVTRTTGMLWSNVVAGIVVLVFGLGFAGLGSAHMRH